MTEISEKEVRAVADVLLGRVNAPEQEIYRAARDGLEAAALAREANAEGGEPVAWAYELANFYTEDRGYYDFELQISKVDPRKTWEIAPDRIRNIRPLYAHPAPQPSGTVEVKPLEWQEARFSDNWDRFTADSLLGTYETIEWSNGGFGGTFAGGREFFAVSMEEAKAVAQADYERRILSALTAGGGNE